MGLYSCNKYLVVVGVCDRLENFLFFLIHAILQDVFFQSSVFLLGTGFDEEAALLGAGREFALMKTASGKVSSRVSEHLRVMKVIAASTARLLS